MSSWCLCVLSEAGVSHQSVTDSWEGKTISRRGAGVQRRIAAKRKRNAKRETDEGLPRWCGPAFLHLFELLAARTVSVPRGLARECLTRSHRPGLATSSSPVPSAGGATEDRPGRKPGFTDPPRPEPQRGDRIQPPLLRCPLGSCGGAERRRDPVGSSFCLLGFFAAKQLRHFRGDLRLTRRTDPLRKGCFAAMNGRSFNACAG